MIMIGSLGLFPMIAYRAVMNLLTDGNNNGRSHKSAGLSMGGKTIRIMPYFFHPNNLNKTLNHSLIR